MYFNNKITYTVIIIYIFVSFVVNFSPLYTYTERINDIFLAGHEISGLIHEVGTEACQGRVFLNLQ